MADYKKYELEPFLHSIPVLGTLTSGVEDIVKFFAGADKEKPASEILLKALKLGLTLSTIPVLVNAIRSYFAYFDPDLFERISLAKTEKFPTVMFKEGGFKDVFNEAADVLYNQPILGSAIILGLPYLAQNLSSGAYKGIRKKYLDKKSKEVAQKYFREIQEAIYLGKKLQKNELDFETLKKLDYNKRKELADHIYEIYGVDTYKELGLSEEQVKTAQGLSTILKLVAVAPTLVALHEILKPFILQQNLSLTDPVAKAVEAWEGVYLPERAFMKMVPPARFFNEIESEFETRPEHRVLETVLAEEHEQPTPLKDIRKKPKSKQEKALEAMEAEEERKELEEMERVNNLIEKKLEATAPSNPTAVKRRKVNIVTI